MGCGIAISARWLANPNHTPITICLLVFGALVNIAFTIKVKIRALISDQSYISLKSYWLFNLECFSIFWTHRPLSFEHIMTFWCECLNSHLTIVVFNLCTPTLVLITTINLLIFKRRKEAQTWGIGPWNPRKNLKPRREPCTTRQVLIWQTLVLAPLL